MAPFTVIIPARYSSTRLPGKPLLDLAGKTMIQRVYEQAGQSDAGRVVVATDDERIKACVLEFGGEVCMTSPDHESGTDRLAEVAQQLALSEGECVVNVQGDEPLIPPSVINQVAGNLVGSGASMSTLSEVITSEEVAFDPNAVKVVSDKNGIALYFSRAPIPWSRDTFSIAGGGVPKQQLLQRHIGIYGYRVGFLHQFVQWGPCALEQTESLEQLRAMWHGAKIHVEQAVEPPAPGIDTEADLAAVRKLLEVS
ncbi:3-deoxy-manno-octulosonate cytidylyltransferase [Gammaproteobacteria bacterium 42_54_T18]|nr:3-deoxy-manno-octulosonate cytidylyltransferase [Gammaproteobacteria bacterium 42_54_T18]